ncbi:MAG: FadR/GntR family transcriptional regulator [Pseudomonadota bacterium]
MRPDDSEVPGEQHATRSFLYEEVYRQLVRLIERQEYPTGTKLPTELELAARFGVSRPIIRRALDMLRDAEFVATRKGSGTVVVRPATPVGPQFQPLVTIADLQQFYEYRIGVEGQIAEAAAARRTAEDLEAITRTLKRCEAALSQSGSGLAADLNFEFHRAVALASGNRFSIATVQALPNLVGDTPLKQAVSPIRGHAYGWQVHGEHEAIFDAIRDHDPDQARALMVDHIKGAMRFVFANTKV